MKRIYGVVLLLISLLLQSKEGIAQEKITKYQGLRIGADLAEILGSVATPGKTAYIFSVDYEFKGNYFAVLDLGGAILENSNDSTSNKINGFYGLVGLDINGLKKSTDGDILHYGFRYGFSLFSHDIDLTPEYIGTFIDIGKEDLSAHWAEFVTGAKAELWFFKNVFVGLSVRAKFLISKTKEKVIVPSIIPGYGDTSKGVNFDFNWTLSYRIPFKKITIDIVDKKK